MVNADEYVEHTLDMLIWAIYGTMLLKRRIKRS